MGRSNQLPKTGGTTPPPVSVGAPVYQDLEQLRFQIMKSIVIRNLRKDASEIESHS